MGREGLSPAPTLVVPGGSQIATDPSWASVYNGGVLGFNPQAQEWAFGAPTFNNFGAPSMAIRNQHVVRVSQPLQITTNAFNGFGIIGVDTAIVFHLQGQIRTAPLWALRTRNRLMRDGLSFRHRALPSDQVQALMAFLNSL